MQCACCCELVKGGFVFCVLWKREKKNIGKICFFFLYCLFVNMGMPRVIYGLADFVLFFNVHVLFG